MGNCRSVCQGAAVHVPWGAPIREVTFVLLGLDNSGKTTLLANLNKESTEDITPTIGFASTNLDLGRFEVTVYDLGGGARIRDIWKSYYAESYGVIYVVDASSVDRIAEAREVLNNVIQDEKMVGKPLLIFANKQDKDGAVDDNDLGTRLELERLLGENREHSSVVKCVALKSSSGSRSDPAIRTGVQWLLQTVGRRYDEIAERVRADVQVQQAEEARERRERAERVRKIREERERLAALQRAEGGGEEEEEEDGEEEKEMANPFRPIEQVAKEAEERERAAKAAATRRKLAQSPGRVDTVAESTSNVPTGSRDSRSDGGACKLEEIRGKDPEDIKGTELHLVPPKSESQSTLNSNSQLEESGLSTSSNSLTYVTPPSHSHAGSSDSLPFPTSGSPHPPLSSTSQQPPEPVAMPKPGMVNRVKLDPLQAKTVEKRKRQPRRTLLSRLKNRNKTAPSPQSPGSSPPMGAPVSSGHGHVVSTNTWVTPEPASVSESPRPNPEGDPLECLPGMPKIRHVLPPVKVSKKPPGLGEKTFHVAEDITIPQSAILVSQTMPSLESVPA